MVGADTKTLLVFGLAFLVPLVYFSPGKAATRYDSASAPPPIHRFQQYLRIRTDQATPDYAAAIDFLNKTVATLLPDAAFQVHTFVPGKPLALIHIPGSQPHLSSVLLNSHTDVVPAEADKWTSDPFSARLAVVDGQLRVYARGSQDMKCVGMQYLEALSNLMASGWRPRRPTYVSFVPDEEIGGKDGMRELVQAPVFKSMNVGVALDEGLPNPSSKFTVFYGERRNWWISILVQGKPGHGATLPESTAATVLISIVSRILVFREAQLKRLKAGVPLGEIISVNLVFLETGLPDASLDAGYVSNVITSQAKAGFDIRVPPNISNEELEKQIRQWTTCEDGNPCPDVSIQFHIQNKMADVTSRDANDNAFIQPFMAALQDAGIAGRLEHSIFFASTDARFLRAKGIPSFGFTPLEKTPILLHKHDEYMPVDAYMTGISIYECIIKRLADFDPARSRDSVSSDDEGKGEL